MTPRVRITSLDELGEIPVVGGTIRWKPVRRTLGISAFGMNAYVADAGQDVIERHDEIGPAGAGGHEEVYLVLRGHARFEVDGEEVDAPAGTFVFLPAPAAVRSAKAMVDGTAVLAVGGEPGSPYRVSAWEHVFAAEDDVARGDHEAAAATVAGALPEHEGNPSVHYHLARHLDRANRSEQALVELERALLADEARVREWAAGDPRMTALLERLAAT